MIFFFGLKNHGEGKCLPCPPPVAPPLTGYKTVRSVRDHMHQQGSEVANELHPTMAFPPTPTPTPTPSPRSHCKPDLHLHFLKENFGEIVSQERPSLFAFLLITKVLRHCPSIPLVHREGTAIRWLLCHNWMSKV